jgi:RNA polymerase sigma factor (sigma-70 family)
MAAGQLHKVVEHLRNVLAKQDLAQMADGDLLTCYLRDRDEAAFEALLHRHGPMVMGVCRRVLHDLHDAEDAFQATFLVLVRRASSLRSPGRVGNWLYGVAYRSALEARKAAAKRRAKEAKGVPRTESPQDAWADVRPVLDEELDRLPAKYRAAIVLCDLEGKTRKEAARHLGWPEGTVASRLANARVLLAKRLSRYRPALSGGAVATILCQNALACVGSSLVAFTIKAASVPAGEQAATTSVLSASVAALTKGVQKALLFAKLKAALGATVAAAIVGLGLLTFPALRAGPGEVAAAQGGTPLSPGTGRAADAGDSQQVTKVYRLKFAVAERVVVLLRSLFIVVNAQDAYVRFHADATTNSLVVGASRQHQRQIARVLALVDTREQAPAPAAVTDDGHKQLVKGYRLKHADGAATVAVLRSLFLVVNHRVAYARFAYDARGHLLIAIASEKHQKQIATVLGLLDTQKGPGKERAVAAGAAQQVHLIPIQHIDGERLLSILRSRFVVVNHEQAHARFGFDPRTRSLVLITDGKLDRRLRGLIEDLDRPGGDRSAPAQENEGTKGPCQDRLPARARGFSHGRAARAT